MPEIDRGQHAIEILSKTHDGDALTPQHLALLQLVVNRRASDKGLAIFDELYLQVARGVYQRPWLHGEENLLKDHDGYVLWRGRTVEHFSFHQDEAGEARAAHALAAQCRRLEEEGLIPGVDAPCEVQRSADRFR